MKKNNVGMYLSSILYRVETFSLNKREYTWHFDQVIQISAGVFNISILIIFYRRV